ncbi:MAG: helix-turn-helix domain-containing protein [Bacteroidota bacterium]
MDYKTINPGPDLTPFVRCYWTLEAANEPDPQKQRILPDGCMEMIFHYGDLYKQYSEDGSSIIQPKCFVFGQLTKPLDIQPTGRTGIFAVRFNPDGFVPFVTASPDTIENRAATLKELFGNDGAQLQNDILAAGTTANRVEIIETFLSGRAVAAESIDRIIQSTITTMVTLNGKLPVSDISKKLNVNRRQLERRFAAVIGLSPKQLSKIIRLQAAVKMLMDDRPESLTSIAYEGNYYDQAHFIKDFKEFTGVSPKRFYSGGFKMSALFQSME